MDGMSIIHRSLVFLGLRMNSTMGRYFKKSVLIQLGILCVLGPRKFQLIITTVAKIEIQFMTNVKSKYLAIKGSTSEVGGSILDTNSRNTTNDNRMDMPNVTFSPVAIHRGIMVSWWVMRDGKKQVSCC